MPGSNLPVADKGLESFGFKLTGGGAHSSRTIMLDEITRLIGSVSPNARIEAYYKAVVEENILGKATDTTRHKTFRHLRELYALSGTVPIFAVYRDLMGFDSQSAPLLSLLVAWTRDPLLRATTPAVLVTSLGNEVTAPDLQQAFSKTFPDQYSPLNAAKIARNAASSWTQSGHLSGRSKKVRCRVQARPVALTMALLLGHVSHLPSAQLFGSIWCRLLDLGATQARSLAEQAHREALITLRAIGSVVEVSFPRFKQLLEGRL